MGVALKPRLTKRGLMRIFDSVQDTNLTFQSANMKSTSLFNLWINVSTDYAAVSILLDCAFYRPPKLFATAAAFGRIGHYAVVVEHACNSPHVLFQLVVRKLIGFRGNS